jgi:hypothetical protein
MVPRDRIDLRRRERDARLLRRVACLRCRRDYGGNRKDDCAMARQPR